MRIGFAGILLLALLASGMEDEKYLRRSTEDKIKLRNLTFAVTFDRHSVNADLAKGDPECRSGKNTNLALRGTLGFDRAQGFTALPGEELVYSAQGNASAHDGSLVCWLNARDFNPAEDTNRGNMAIAQLRFTDGKRWIAFILYEYKGTIYADWKSSEPPHRWGDTCTLSLPAKEYQLKQNEYFQLIYTWKNSAEVALYCNGKLVLSKKLPGKRTKTADLKPGKDSRITIRPNILADRRKNTLEIDDVMIFSKALTPLEAANLYRSSLKNPSAQEQYHSFSVKLNGIDHGHGRDNETLEAEFDLSGIPDTEREKGLVMDYELTGPDGLHRSGKWKFNKNQTCQYLSGIAKAGTYTLKTRYRKEEYTVSIDRPDMSFLGNSLGKDEIPELWRDFRAEGRTVTLWNRKYHFGAGPFPESITVKDKPLLKQAPVLLVNGKPVTGWTAGGSRKGVRSVIYSGSGTIPGGSIAYRTEVAFDGLIDCRFTVSGKPEVSDMRLEWQVAEPFTEFLMVPELYEKIANPARFNLRYDMNRAVELWFVSAGKGGFCWSYENDANWIYEPADNILSADLKTGQCSVRMIGGKKVVIPDGAVYNALFIATPVRPLPKQIRGLCWGTGGTVDLLHGQTGVLTGPVNFEPDPVEFPKQMKRFKPGKFAINGLANALTAADPVALYFEKYCESPGAPNYNIPFRTRINGKLELKRYRTISTCNRSFVNDFFLWNIRKLLDHPMGDRIGLIYYDLCGNRLCSNPLHGCRFKDKFGRDISSWSVLTLRDLVIRTVTYAHSRKRQVFLHGQRSFYPMIQGTADYWFPGEEQMSLLMRNPFGYTDEISDKIYRSEFNRDVRGVGCILLPTVTLKGKAMRSPDSVRATEACVGMCLLHDVEFWSYQGNFSVFRKIFAIKQKYHFENAKVFPYYTRNGISSDEPDLRVTRYQCPGGINLLVVMNKEPRKRTGTLDFSEISRYSGPLTEEYTGEKLQAKEGRLKITVPARSFRLIPLQQ